MKYRSFLPGLLFLAWTHCLCAQTIVADTVKGCDSLVARFSLVPPVTTGSSLSWDFAGGVLKNSDQSAPVVLFRNPGVYTISCRINNTTTVTAPGLVKVYKSPSSHFIYRDTLQLGEYSYFFKHVVHSADISPYNLLWQFSDDGSTEITETVVHDFSETGVYNVRLIASSVNGCSDTTSQVIAVADLLDIPNVFTPNDDAINDVFEVRTDGIHNYVFSVYTRSGLLVYRSESPVISWDGRSFAGALLTPGLYYYIIHQTEQESVPRETKGIVYLLH